MSIAFLLPDPIPIFILCPCRISFWWTLESSVGVCFTIAKRIGKFNSVVEFYKLGRFETQKVFCGFIANSQRHFTCWIQSLLPCSFTKSFIILFHREMLVALGSIMTHGRRISPTSRNPSQSLWALIRPRSKHFPGECAKWRVTGVTINIY